MLRVFLFVFCVSNHKPYRLRQWYFDAEHFNNKETRRTHIYLPGKGSLSRNNGHTHLYGSWENQQSAYAVTAKLISAFVFATRIVQFLFYFKLLVLFCACTGRFVSDLFGNHIVGFPTRRLIYYFIKIRLVQF